MNGTKARILVVDDNDAARYWAVRTLRKEGYDILEATCGEQALDVARREKPDLVLLDVRLPDMLGFHVAEQLRTEESTKSIAILQISASFTGADAQAHGLRQGADSYLTTPVDPQILAATVHALLRMRSAEQLAQSERLRAEQALAAADDQRRRAEASEAYYRFVADMVPQLVWSTTAKGEPDYFNRRWDEFSGAHGKVGSPDWMDSIHPDDRDEFVRKWSHSLETGEPLEMECRRFSPPVGAYRWLLVRAMPMKDANGAVTRWFGTSTDIEAQKQAIAERERLLKESQTTAIERDALVAKLQEESERKNEFLAVLSHELRNPLAPIRNSVYILGRAVPGSEQARRARDVIDRQAHHMSRLVDDLLDVTRIARGKIRLQKDNVELGSVVRRSAEDHRGLFKRSGIDLGVDVPDQIMMVDADSTRLSQVVGNLLQNAAKFTPAGGSVSVSLSRSGPHEATISVRDTGAGIAPDSLPHLFEAFVQGERTLDRSTGGLGLGLALAKGIVELHGGSIIGRSDGPGKGAEFIVKLPLAATSAAGLGAAAGQVASKEGRRVLIIEDMQDAGESLRDVLQMSGHVVEIAHDGPTGVALARDFNPDVVLCDIGLPGMNGYGVARQMRKDPKLRDMFLVALSGYALQEDVERSKEAGFDRHMSKPPRLDDLETILVRAPRRTEAHP